MTDATRPRKPRYKIIKLQDQLKETGFFSVMRSHDGAWDAMTPPVSRAAALSECERLRRIDSGNLSWAEFRRYTGQV